MFISHVRELGLVRQLCYGHCLQQLGVCLSAPSFQGLGLVTASWHVLLRPWSPGEAAALHTHLSMTTSCSVLTRPMAAPCPLTSSPLFLTPVPALGVCLSVSWLSQLPPPHPGCCISSSCNPFLLSKLCSREGCGDPCLASSCKAVWVILPIWSFFRHTTRPHHPPSPSARELSTRAWSTSGSCAGEGAQGLGKTE